MEYGAPHYFDVSTTVLFWSPSSFALTAFLSGPLFHFLRLIVVGGRSQRSWGTRFCKSAFHIPEASFPSPPPPACYLVRMLFLGLTVSGAMEQLARGMRLLSTRTARTGDDCDGRLRSGSTGYGVCIRRCGDAVIGMLPIFHARVRPRLEALEQPTDPCLQRARYAESPLLRGLAWAPFPSTPR